MANTSTRAARNKSGRASKESETRPPVNDVRLTGRLSAPPEMRVLPSNDELVQLRIVVPRPPAARVGGRSPTVDTIDVACWSAASRKAALKCDGTEVVTVEGALRRRFWQAPHGKVSRYEVEARTIRVVGGRS